MLAPVFDAENAPHNTAGHAAGRGKGLRAKQGSICTGGGSVNPR